MPIQIPADLPARSALESENIFVMTDERAIRQDIRPLDIVIVNLMPTKIATETQLLRLLGAHLYGLYLERLYMASVMVLAAAESDTLEPLYQVHTGLATRHGKALEILGKKGMLGLEDCEARHPSR